MSITKVWIKHFVTAKNRDVFGRNRVTLAVDDVLIVPVTPRHVNMLSVRWELLNNDLPASSI